MYNALDLECMLCGIEDELEEILDDFSPGFLEEVLEAEYNGNVQDLWNEMEPDMLYMSDIDAYEADLQDEWNDTRAEIARYERNYK